MFDVYCMYLSLEPSSRKKELFFCRMRKSTKAVVYSFVQARSLDQS